MMYDTVGLWLSNEEIKENGYLTRIPTLLSNTKETFKQDTGEIYFTGSILGMNASVSNAGVSLSGSICKSYLNDNFKTLNRQDGPRAIEKLADCLKLPMDKANVSRIDIAQNFIVSQSPESYFAFLGDCNHYKRLTQPKSLYYKNGMRTKLFYNKIAEGKANGHVIPPIWANKHVLRYEFRFLNRLPKQLNKVRIQAFNLFEEKFYMELIDRWIQEYESIYKNNLILDSMNMEQVKKPNDFKDQLALTMIKQFGLNHIFECIEQMKAQNQFKHKEYYSRLKTEMRKLCESEFITEKSPLINELDKKIRQVKEYYR